MVMEFAKEYPVEKWSCPTSILYGTKDNLTERATVDNFVRKFQTDLRVLEGGEHWFHTEEQVVCLKDWLDISLK